MEGYVTAARKISRVAVGDPTLPLIVDTYRLPLELPQDDQFAELPLGTRGGALIRRHFPVDGEYLIKVELAGAAREPHDFKVSVDGERVGLLPLAPNGVRPNTRMTAPPTAAAHPVARRAAHGCCHVREKDVRGERSAGAPVSAQPGRPA